MLAAAALLAACSTNEQYALSLLMQLQEGQVTVSMAEANLNFSWEYAGNAPKLVITSLTDR